MLAAGWRLKARKLATPLFGSVVTQSVCEVPAMPLAGLVVPVAKSRCAGRFWKVVLSMADAKVELSETSTS